MREEVEDILNAKSACSKIESYIETVTGGVLIYNARIFKTDFKSEDTVTNYLTVSGQVQALYEAIHIENSTKNPVFNWRSEPAADGYKSDGIVDYAELYGSLI